MAATSSSNQLDQGIFLDYVLYNTSFTAGKTIFIDDSDTRVEYSAGWETLTLDSYFLQTAHITLESESWMSLAFEGVH